ncbi:MAG: helix-turn-helix transcriptional regulator [Clostridiales bacterium]|nr:helix-turn-helix transcriptional regulator [Clostridiales bacterium]
MNLGQKIRQARKLRGITQAELAGERITRNMLSQIENNIASPSVQTLLYLAERLDVPVGYFLSDSDDDLAYKKIHCLDEIKTYYRNRNYQSCIDIIESKLGEADDEIRYILAECTLRLGEGAFNRGAFATAAAHLRKTLSHCDKTIYNCKWIRARALLLLSIIEDVDLPMHNMGADYSILAEKSIGIELYLYILSLSLAESLKSEAVCTILKSFKFNNPVYRMHIAAKLMMTEGRYLSAAESISEILYKRPKEELSALVRYKLYADLESCCRETNDFEGAYGYASKRLQLIAEMKN